MINLKKCKECLGEFRPQNELQPVCSISCALKYNKKLLKIKEENEWKSQRKKILESLKTITEYKSEAKEEFQKFIRMRDSEQLCVSCGTTTSTMWDGGHYFEATQFPGLMFDERNCHKQCRKCNKYLHSNWSEYRIGLIKRYGEAYVNSLENDAQQSKLHTYTKKELIEIKEKYRAKNKSY